MLLRLMLRAPAAFSLLCTGLLACSTPAKEIAPPITSVSLSAGPVESVRAPAPTQTLELGTYVSPRCGPREHPREVTFDAKGFTAVDLVSPCPPKVACVWSGIVRRSGTYAITGSVLAVDVRAEDSGPGAMLFPSSFELRERSIVEASEGGPCAYTLK